MESSIQVGVNGPSVWVRVKGRGSFLNSGGLKDFARAMVNKGFREFVFDLQDCVMMDSTFMGTMAGMALRLKDLGPGRLHVVKDGPATQGETQKREQAGTMLAAHEALCAAAPENLTRFKDVLEYLKQDLHQESPAN